MNILAGLWAILLIGTAAAYLLNAAYLVGIRFLFGSLIALGGGLGAKGAYYSGSLRVGLALAMLLCFLSWLTLPSLLRLGPSLSVPSVGWIITSAAVGFLFANRRDAGSAARGNEQADAHLPREHWGTQISFDAARARYNALEQSDTRTGDQWRSILMRWVEGDELWTFDLGARAGLLHVRQDRVIARLNLTYRTIARDTASKV